MKIVASALSALLLLGTAAYAVEPAKMSADGKVYTDGQGMTLYTFDKDAAGKSNCDGDCAVKWPPFKAESGAEADGDWTLVERSDGTMMWAYDGKPLYTYEGDKKAGDMTGDGVGEVWHLATPG
jgi:predicted lipoprotein with Yx(FWY)xxD motif